MFRGQTHMSTGMVVLACVAVKNASHTTTLQNIISKTILLLSGTIKII